VGPRLHRVRRALYGSSWGYGGVCRRSGGGLVMSRVVAVVACGFTLAACSASMPSLEFLKSSSETETVRVESQPPGAEAKAASGQSCRTPCELNVAGGGETTITLALNGYQPQTVSLQAETSGALGSITGSTRLAPNPVQVELQPAPAPSAKKAAAKKKKPVTAARPAASSVASAAPPAAPAAPAPEAPAEAAASATNFPWPSR
jgi:PEGA domain